MPGCRSLKRKAITFTTLDVRIVVILKSLKQRQEAYLYRVKNDMFFKCHNCGEGQSLTNFLKFLDNKKYEQYLLERYKGSAPSTPQPKFNDFKPKFKEVDILDGLTSS